MVPGPPLAGSCGRSLTWCVYPTMRSGADWEDVGERMRVARLAASLTQEELSARAGLDRTMLVKIESGARRIDAITDQTVVGARCRWTSCCEPQAVRACRWERARRAPGHGTKTACRGAEFPRYGRQHRLL